MGSACINDGWPDGLFIGFRVGDESVSLSFEPGEGGTQEGQSLTGTCGAFEEGVLVADCTMDDFLHVLSLAVVGLEGEVDCVASNDLGVLLVEDFSCLDYNFMAG